MSGSRLLLRKLTAFKGRTHGCTDQVCYAKILQIVIAKIDVKRLDLEAQVVGQCPRNPRPDDPSDIRSRS